MDFLSSVTHSRKLIKPRGRERGVGASDLSQWIRSTDTSLNLSLTSETEGSLVELKP